MMLRGLVVGFVMAVGVVCGAQQTVPVVMLSDIHFDPFHDPAKVARLRTAAVGAWEGILKGADSATQAKDFDALQDACKAKGVDTPMPLLVSSLNAERAQEPKPLFVTVSGDLMAHKFDCKFKTMTPKATEAEYSAFAAKTVAFVTLELKETFPGVPVYLALGNNDSGCEDYAEDENSAFLKADGQSFAGVVLNAKNAAAIVGEFSKLGDYNVELPKPFEGARLIVLQDIFESKRYASCSGAQDTSAAKAQIDWLRGQLSAAAAKHEVVWVMAHIPPGIDAYSTLTKFAEVCGGEKPTMFLGSKDLADVLTEYAGTVRLGLFAHTHMDEMKSLHGETASAARVPIKLVPSISPVNGNNPAFTVAKVDPKTATLVDYSVYAANNKMGVGTVWSREYTYSATYKLPDYSAESAAKLVDGFVSDKAGTSAASQAYQQFYFVGDPGISANLKAAAMRMVWPGYACSMAEGGAKGFRECACKQ